ncbi:class I SAM-dependent methyltransferase [Dokdonia sinensis]|uniref:Class I SAM-dependent methyltransferase n=1 Tax=Dokdonia sinensis TaxID=2479847 RepID=A0A3M0G6L4_9FLAO|nr:class I SAM-dependent methyltransferase [Dokdonia sinensis]RMB57952.1 class I SAM-dependent methyltransferase [Dokdonia sinensis]
MNPKIWTPRYIVNRMRNFFFEKRHKDLPWITPEAIAILDEMLTKEDVGVEFGSGKSTAWYAKRMKHLTSVEDHEGWYNAVKKQFETLGLNNVDYLFKSAQGQPEQSDYCKVMNDFEKNSLDFIVVDGKHRDILALEAIDKLKVGGVLLLDDSQRYLAHTTVAPYAVGDTASNMTDNWKNFQNRIKAWRMIWTSNGVSDTAIFIKK